ncbi:WYL domain-containing protein [Paenibacillus agricola]|uniref:WYL domain-containing protein n=1 Tax=Paenibacillus agricola TaxID=2716264 RepID=UPI004063D711
MQVFPLLRKVIATNRIIKFRYFNTAGQQSDRSVEPVSLLFKNPVGNLKYYPI